MDQLLELISMLGDDYLPCGNNKLGVRVRKLFAYLKNAEAPSESEGARIIGVEEGSSAYRKVKHHLKLALINGVTAIEPAADLVLKDRAATNDKSWNYFAASKSGVSSVNDFLVAADIAELVESGARAFDLQEPLLGVCLSLVNNSSMMARNNYSDIVRQALTELEYDYKLQVGHGLFVQSTNLSINRASNDEKISFLEEAIEEMNSITAVERFRVRSTSLYLGLKLYTAREDYHGSIDFIKGALKLLDPTDPVQQPMVTIFGNNLLRAYLYSCRHQEGVAFGKYLLSEDIVRKSDLYASQELTMMLALRGGDYELAYRIYQQVLRSDSTNTVSHNFKETFLIIEAYLHLLVKMELIAVPEEVNTETKLRIGKFINDTSFSFKEKKRRNIHVVIVKILYEALYNSDRDFDQSDAIRKYVQRHLSEEGTSRAKNFILALVQLPENGFNMKFAASKSQRYLELLSQNPIGANKQHPYGEMIPFERLWGYLRDFKS